MQGSKEVCGDAREGPGDGRTARQGGGGARWPPACVVPGFSSTYWQEVEDGATPGGLGRQVGWPAGL